MINRTLYLFLLSLSFLVAQINGKSIAILDFEGIGVNSIESSSLTGIFHSEVTKTNTVTLVDRKTIKQTLLEQNINQALCKTLECISKAGASLNVDLIMSGIITKNNDSFSLEVNIFQVSNAMKPLVVTSLVDGKVVVRKKFKESKISPIETKKVVYKGTIDGFINAIEITAWRLMGLEPPEVKIQKEQDIAQALITQNYNRYATVIRSSLVPGLGQFYSGQRTWGWIWLTSETILGALALNEYKTYKSSLDNYRILKNEYSNSKNPEEIDLLRIKAQISRNEMIKADEQMTAMVYALGGLWMANIVHALLIKPKGTNQLKNQKSVNLTYNNLLKQPQLSFSVQLD